MRTKFVRIERGPEYRNREYTTIKAAEHMIAAGTATSYTPVTLKTIKAERLFEYREADYFRHVAEEAFHATYDKKRFKAKVVDGGPQCEMLVQLLNDDGTPHDGDLRWLQEIYACNIAGKKTWYPETACVFYETGEIVDVEIQVMHGFERFVIGLTPGHVDQEHWDRIKDKSLAFRCNEAGEAVTGLFAASKGEK